MRTGFLILRSGQPQAGVKVKGIFTNPGPSFVPPLLRLPVEPVLDLTTDSRGECFAVVPLVVGLALYAMDVEVEGLRIRGTFDEISNYFTVELDYGSWQQRKLNPRIPGDGYFFVDQRLLTVEDLINVSEDPVQAISNCAACLPPGELVMINPGQPQPVETLHDQRILNHLGNFTEGTLTKPHAYSGPLIEVQILGRPISIRATPDHLVLAAQRPKNWKHINREEWRKQVSPTWIPIGALKRQDFVASAVPKDFDSSFTDPSLARLMGYYLAEGHCGGAPHIRRISFSFGWNEAERSYVEDVANLCKQLFGRQVHIRSRKPTTTLVTLGYSALARQFASELGNLAEEKKVPLQLLCAGSEVQRELLRGLWRGDGHFGDNRGRAWAIYATISSSLASAVRFLLMRQGITFNWHTRPPRRGADGVSHKLSHYIYVQGEDVSRLAAIVGIPLRGRPTSRRIVQWYAGGYLWAPIKSIKSIPFSGNVYDLHVENGNSFTHWSGVALHNCLYYIPTLGDNGLCYVNGRRTPPISIAGASVTTSRLYYPRFLHPVSPQRALRDVGRLGP